MAFAQSKLIMDRLSFGFHNPNHAAALACALLPLCLGWRRAAWVGRGLAASSRSRRLAPRDAIDPEYLNPLYDASVADLWRRDAP